MIKGIFDVVTKPTVRPEWRWRALRTVTRWLMPNYRLVLPEMSWWNDQNFNEYMHQFNEDKLYNSDRRWIISQLAKLVHKVPGDTAECGVFEGSSSYLICSALPDRNHFMFDSFEGCSAPGMNDTQRFPKNTMASNVEIVERNMRSFPNARCMKGWIPQRFPEVADRRFAFLHIDVQHEQPTADSLAFFYPRMNSGGVIAFDDYGFTTCPGARRAIDNFLSDKMERVIHLPSSSAFIIKA